MDNIFRRLRTCEQSHRGVAEQIHSWRTLFSAAGTSVACQQQDASEQMQISPVGAEGSNVMPGQPARAEAAEVRRLGVQNSLLTHLGRDGTPHAGSTAGEGAHPTTAIWLHPANPAGKVKHADGLLSCLLLQHCTPGNRQCNRSMYCREEVIFFGAYYCSTVYLKIMCCTEDITFWVAILCLPITVDLCQSRGGHADTS